MPHHRSRTLALQADALQRPLRFRFRARLSASVRLLEAAKSVQRACYTDWSRLCPVGSVLYRRGPHSMP